MSKLSAFLRPMPPPDTSDANIGAIRARIADGIPLGGDYASAFEEYLQAHRDRIDLLARVDELEADL